MKNKLIASFFGVSLFMTSLVSLAQIPEAQTANGIQFVSGGIGLDESGAIKADAKHWPLHLEFSQIEGQKAEWVAGVNLRIMDSKGNEIFQHEIDGPLALIKLPEGKYSLEATYLSRKVGRQFEIQSGKSQRLSIFWK